MKIFKKYLEIIQESPENRIKAMTNPIYKKFVNLVPEWNRIGFIFITDISNQEFTGNTSTGDKKEISDYKERIHKLIEIIKDLKQYSRIKKEEINPLLDFIIEQINNNTHKFFNSEIKQYFLKEIKNLYVSSNHRIEVMKDKRYKKFIQFVPNRYEKDFDFITNISNQEFTGNTSTGDKKEISDYKEKIDKFIKIVKILKTNPGIKDEINVLLNFVKEEIKKNKNEDFKSNIKEYFLKELDDQYISPSKI